MPNGDEGAWQAKFFLKTQDTDWGQLDKSVRTALDKHPRLTSYTICMPFDRPDARNPGEKSFLDRWEEHVAKWKRWASEKGMEVGFPYWGDHELGLRLSREEHRGRRFYWFGQEHLSHSWFRERLEESIERAGDRYTSALDVQLPISRAFEALGRTPSWRERLLEQRGKIRNLVGKCSTRDLLEVASDEYRSLKNCGNELYARVTAAALNGVKDRDENLKGVWDGRLSSIDWASIEDTVRRMIERCETLERLLERADAEEKRRNEKSGGTMSTRPLGISDSERRPDFSYSKHQLGRLSLELGSLLRWMRGDEGTCANTTAVLLCGEAGRGKTHLLCDVAEARISSNLPTVLLMGQDFGAGDPWGQMLAQLGLDCSTDEFLGALDAAGEASSGKSVIMVDALNETTDKSLWRRSIGAMLTRVARFPHVVLVFSVRSSYVKLVIPEHVDEKRLWRIIHEGFAGHESVASVKFFSYYGLQAPSVPLLTPEFSVPLFLKLFCQGLKKAGLSNVPRGFRGRSTIFRFFVGAVNKDLSRPERLDYDPRSNPVDSALRSVAKLMRSKKRAWLTPREAQEAVSHLIPSRGYERSMYRNLVSESLLNEDNVTMSVKEFGEFGLLREDKSPVSDLEFGDTGYLNTEVVRFAYEKMGDHFLAEEWLDQNSTSPESLAYALGPNGPLSALHTDISERYRNAGFLEALSVLVPERGGGELVDFFSECPESAPLVTGFLESLLWRHHEAFSERTLELVNELLVQDLNNRSKFYSVWLTLAGVPDHPYNARLLHRNLYPMAMPDRDSVWSIWVHHEYQDESSPVCRLINWAWFAPDKSNIEDEAVLLCALTLAWIFTTPNRFARDRATKAAISLLQDRLDVLNDWLTNFWGVNDPYVMERVLAVACGCVMRAGSHKKEVGKVAQNVYDNFFASGRPPFHLLARDYARQIVDTALRAGVSLEVEPGKIRPPYGDISEDVWPTIPTEEEIEQLREPPASDLPSTFIPGTDQPKGQEWLERDREEGRGMRGAIFFSTTEWGDFHRYVVESRGGDYVWSGHRLSNPPRRVRIRAWEKSLSRSQARTYNEFLKSWQSVAYIVDTDRELRSVGAELSWDPLKWETFQPGLDADLGLLKRKLNVTKRKFLDDVIIPALKDGNGDFPKDEDIQFDHNASTRWIVQKVFDLGWTNKRFGRFDSYANHSGDRRSAHKAERIGKKYQWIAFAELLARQSDTFYMRAERSPWDGELETYNGPWRLSSRDLDPTWLLPRTCWQSFDEHKTCWWSPIRYDAWSLGTDSLSWLKTENDSPRLEDMIEVVDPTDGTVWLVLETSARFHERPVPGEDRYETIHRKLSLRLNSYLVHKRDAAKWWRWAKNQNFTGAWMPRPPDMYTFWWGEYYGSYALDGIDGPYYGIGWEGESRDYKQMPCAVLVTSQNHLIEESGFDCSIEATMYVNILNIELAKLALWRPSREEGVIVDVTGKTVAFDPTVRESGPGALLIRKDAMIEYLEENGMELVWTLSGEKRVQGPTASRYYIGHQDISGAAKLDAKGLVASQSAIFCPPS